MTLLEATGLVKTFPVERSLLGQVTQRVHAVDGVDLAVDPGRTLGLVGESGSGKSTTARLVLRLLEADSGTVLLDGQDVTRAGGRALRRLRRRMQMVFQDPLSALDPSMSIAEAIVEPLRVHGEQGRDELRGTAGRLAERVGLGAHHLEKRPAQLSGGQRQRACIARAIALDPSLVVLDEAVSALDVSVQAQVVNLLLDLQEAQGLAYLFIAHDLPLVRQVSDEIAVMYLGRIVERGPADAVSDEPLHPYTEALLSASPVAHPERQRARERIVLAGDIPDPTDPPSGCRFRTRCPYAMEICAEQDPELTRHGQSHEVACHLHAHGPRLAGESVTVLRSSADLGA